MGLFYSSGEFSSVDQDSIQALSNEGQGAPTH